ncbi:SgcJ/EcaC family oxidoreductase [Chryseobacterium sp. H1D6B]|uniref:YybH family protein n=1 Tax=Chryseobacterium sp. H1D6B TaxID=2940588 RepID=UPI0015CC30A2|nr:SgcJ/EcaC family oxidoreductase [Chryseobacterium sp. H1D6B]
MEKSTEKSAIEKLLFNYQDALNTSDVNKVLPLYAQDGIFMPQGGPSAIGQEQLKGAYEFVFKNLQLNIKFNIDEIVIVNDHYAFARTISRGTQLIHATGITSAEENRELFMLQKENDQWKIARYVFNKMK